MRYDADHKHLQILLADDDEDDRSFFRDAIEQINIKTTLDTVNDGQELMDYLNKRTLSLPDVLFLDLNMPRKNGLECLSEIRASAKLKNIITAIYSTSLSDTDIEDTFIKGANIYINKPSSFQKLKDILTEVIQINWQYHTSTLNKDNFLLLR